jgi:hypothetical protein
MRQPSTNTEAIPLNLHRRNGSIVPSVRIADNKVKKLATCAKPVRTSMMSSRPSCCRGMLLKKFVNSVIHCTLARQANDPANADPVDQAQMWHQEVRRTFRPVSAVRRSTWIRGIESGPAWQPARYPKSGYDAALRRMKRRAKTCRPRCKKGRGKLTLQRDATPFPCTPARGSLLPVQRLEG